MQAHPLHACGGRRLVGKSEGERVEVGGFPFGVDAHTFPVVQNPAAHQVASCEPVHERPETDALDDADDLDIESFEHAASAHCGRIG